MIFNTLIPIFLTLLLGFSFAKVKGISADTETFIHQFVLHLGLPAVLFLSIATADIDQLLNWPFVLTVTGGIVMTYGIAILWAKYQGINHPDASLIGMAGSYGLTGFMGIPLMMMAFGPPIAIVAALATVLHNIPVIVTVVAAYEIGKKPSAQQNRSRFYRHLGKIIFTNPLMLAVIVGAVFAVTPLTLPVAITQFCRFFGAAAGPCGLFSLGIALAKISTAKRPQSQQISRALPIILIKLLIHPMITFILGYFIFQLPVNDWGFIGAVMMAALPIGVAAHVFAKHYQFYSQEIALASVISLILSFITLTGLLYFFTDI